MTSDRNQKPVKSKKSETLEVRIPYETKQAFLTACREDGTTASEVVRESVQTYLDERERPPIQEKRTLVMKLPRPVRHYGPRIAAGSIAAIGLATFAALPSAAAPDFKAQFNQMDANGDGVLSPEEFLGPKTSIVADKGEKNIVIETRKIVRTDDAADAPKPTWTQDVKQESFAFALPDEVGGGEEEKRHEFKFITRKDVKEAKPGETGEETFTFTIDDFRKNEFDSIDTDKDGKVSLGEYQARQIQLFTRGFEILDQDKDKFLSKDEYARIVAPPVVIHLDDDKDTPPPQIHIDGGPKVSSDTLDAAFTRLDINKDGKLSLQEYLPQT